MKHNAVEAAKLSKAVGKPVHLLYTRQQEFQNGYFRPNSHHVLRGQLEGGKITAMQHELATADMVLWGLSPLAMTVLGADFISAINEGEVVRISESPTEMILGLGWQTIK